MIAVIKGDIIGSRKLSNPEEWIAPMRSLLSQWGNEPVQWEMLWGDFFQLEISNTAEALEKSIAIKALIKSIAPKDSQRKSSIIDVRMSIGLGDKTYSAKKISESNGAAFVHSGEQFELLKKDKVNLAVRSSNPRFDKEMNLYLKLSLIFMDHWSISSAQMASTYLQNPEVTQAELGKILGIKQNSVSGRWSRSNMENFVALNQIYKSKLSENQLQ